MKITSPNDTFDSVLDLPGFLMFQVKLVTKKSRAFFKFWSVNPKPNFIFNYLHNWKFLFPSVVPKQQRKFQGNFLNCEKCFQDNDDWIIQLHPMCNIFNISFQVENVLDKRQLKMWKCSFSVIKLCLQLKKNTNTWIMSAHPVNEINIWR